MVSEKRALSKGEKTKERILDAAETAFAGGGYEGATLREIAAAAGIKEPGLYNHFSGKEQLYAAVLERGLQPLVDTLNEHLEKGGGVRAFTDLPLVITDLLAEHPKIAALFQQAMHAERGTKAAHMMSVWLERLFQLGADTMRAVGYQEVDERDIAIYIIAMFNLCCGYFMSQHAFSVLAEGDLLDPENLARQKSLLTDVVRISLV